ncbi:hypothetical protein V5N11_009121 [Cardamine amara subsp. amara]|uniref:Reverse transcriptase domain-containing protein n=1 Tax=Cardamine amara subsp. amara TaxID=228776 RepID=A0ABD1C7P6_CARAN
MRMRKPHRFCCPRVFEKEPRDTLILGRPFLSTAGALIDIPNGKIDLHLSDSIMKFDMNDTLKQKVCDNHIFSVDELEKTTVGIFEMLALEVPMEVALTRDANYCHDLKDSTGNCEKILDSAESYQRHGAYLNVGEKVITPEPPKNTSAMIADPWSELREPKVELKQLPIGLKYAFLGPNSTYSVIINSGLNKEETIMLLTELRKHRKALGYSLEDIPGISPNLCMHRIHLKEGSKNSIEHQRRLNRNLKNVVKKEIMKLMDAGIIYPISDSTWVSPVHVVPKKGGVTVRMTSSLRQGRSRSHDNSGLLVVQCFSLHRGSISLVVP